MHNQITILCSGTRGDVQPLVALGLGLQAAGVAVRFATHPPFRSLVEAAGLAFVSIDPNPSALLANDPAGALTLSQKPLRSLLASVRYLQQVQPHVAQLLRRAWVVCQGADAVVVGLPTLWGTQIAEALGIPAFRALLQPLDETAAFASPLIPLRLPAHPLINRLSHRLTTTLVWRPWRGLFNRWRRAQLGLGRLPAHGPTEPSAPVLYGFSPAIVPPPADWPRNRHITGYWFLDAPAQWHPPAELQRFLAHGPPPVAISLGSIGAEQRVGVLATMCAALDTCGVRGLISVGAHVQLPDLPSTIMRVGALPHSWLFPHVAAVVQHGGAGTTGAALRAGVPTVIVAVGIDNLFWGDRLAALGVAPPPLALRTVTVEALASAINRAVNAEGLRGRALELGQSIRAERGVEQAVQIMIE